jgi:hypothetical protein
MRNETPATIRIQKARTTLLLDHPFFGSLLFRLKGARTAVDSNHGDRWRVALLQP